MIKGADAARELLAQAGHPLPPIPVEELARQRGARLSFEPFEGDVSGMILRDEERIVIGVNSAHAHTRQRFTIAHELGHLLLHEGRRIIIDRSLRLNLRDSRSALATSREEIAANAFAAELLMPEAILREEVARVVERRPGISDTYLVQELARKFDVSEQAMTYRLVNLGILSPLATSG
jgi:Zn-dependent peptidase ImmA (M78 family)